MTLSNHFEFEIEISAQDATVEDIDRMTRQLLIELRNTDIERVGLVSSEHLLKGSKSVDPVTIGVLAVSVLPTLLPKIVDLVQAWALRGQGKVVKFKGKVNGQIIEFEGSSSELEKLMKNLQKRKHKSTS